MINASHPRINEHLRLLCRCGPALSSELSFRLPGKPACGSIRNRCISSLDQTGWNFQPVSSFSALAVHTYGAYYL